MKLKHEKMSDSVPKVPKRLYHQRYRKEWEDNPSFAPWLQASNHGFSAHCRACSVDILARLASIKQHQNTVKHQNGMKCNQVLLDHIDEARNALPDEHEEYISLESKEEEFASVRNSVKSEQIESIPPYKYRKDWEEIPNFAPWLQASNIGHLAHCKICNVNMLARIASLKQHETSAKHQKALIYNKIYTNSQIEEDEGNLDVDHEEFLDSKTKPKTRAQSSPEQFYKVERVEYNDDNENEDDSILDTLLSAEEMGTYSNDEDIVEIEDQHEEEQEQDQELDQQQDFFVQDIAMNVDEQQGGGEEKDDEENQIINEFDLFGKSVALQLNQMDLEDALLCQDRLQAVITNFRLRVLKRQKQSKIR